MPRARFAIGIDLGTTNSALAFAPLDGEEESRVLAVPQWETLASLADSETLPSFLYLPEDAAAARLGSADGATGEWVVGRLARTKAAEAPGRVAHSAKSWLCHHAADRTAPFLPWGSDELAHDRKISPIRASALILGHLRAAWDAAFAGAGPELAFDAQEIVITVPASFDAVAQRLTLAAAAEAGFPGSVRLIEEPQAAFYRWLEAHGGAGELRLEGTGGGDTPLHVVVVDIGGGTSDFSLFALEPAGRDPAPRVRRIAVSDHILLGGDNIDLALAHRVEPRLNGDGGRLGALQWAHLVAACRDLKERVLSAEGGGDGVLAVSVPGRGSALVAGSLSAEVSRNEIEDVLLEGFFPDCDAGARPRRTRAALKELGLPYAVDGAVTRHLADFLRDRPPVDFVLFNGGTLRPRLLRERLLGQIERWQGGRRPIELANAEPELAVARGAARFGTVLGGRGERIEAGAGRAVFLEVLRRRGDPGAAPEGPSLVCVLPRGAAAEETFEIGDLGLELRLNRPVRFQAFSSTRDQGRAAGAVVDWTEEDFQALPPLETVARLDRPPGGRAGARLPVTLRARLNELGLLQVACVSADPTVRRSWPLEFDLRPRGDGQGDARAPLTATGAPAGAAPNVPPAALEAAQERITSQFERPLQRRDPLTATRLLKSLEGILALPKGGWNWVVVRSLWPALADCMGSRARSVEHEEAWLILAGFLLRPGFGAPMDDHRIDGLWRLRDQGLRFPGKRIKLQEHILWRRVAGGLSRERQEAVLAPELDAIRRQKQPPPELARLAGSLERLGLDAKTELFRRFLGIATELARDGKDCAAYLAALGLLLNRTPLYAGPEAVVAPALVEEAYQAFAGLDWAGPQFAELQTLFLRAARMTGDRNLDVARDCRHSIARRLEKAGVAPLKTVRLREYAPVERSERASVFGEALPPGLILGGGGDAG